MDTTALFENHQQNIKFIKNLEEQEQKTLIDLLHSVDFMCEEEIPLSLYKYIFEFDTKVLLEKFQNCWIEDELKSLIEWWQMDSLRRQCHAAQHGNLQRLIYLKKIHQLKLIPCLFRKAVVHLSIVKWLHEQKCPWNYSVFIEACKVGNLETIQWLYHAACPFNEDALLIAIQCNDLKVIHWIHSTFEIELTEKYFLTAIKRGDKEIVQWLLDLGCPYSYYWAIHNNCISGSLEVLELLMTLNQSNVDGVTLSVGQLNYNYFAKLAIEHGTIFAIQHFKKVKNIKLYPSFCTHAIYYNKLPMLQWLKENGCAWNKKSCIDVAKYNCHYEIVNWITNYKPSTKKSYKYMTLAQLRQVCVDKNLDTKGKKADLIKRLEDTSTKN